jgi:hypothetical protein
MEEHERVAAQVLPSDPDDVPRPRQTRLRVSHRSLRLQAPLSQPSVHQRESGTTVVVLLVLYPHRAAFAHHGAMAWETIGYAREELGEVDRGVGIRST